MYEDFQRLNLVLGALYEAMRMFPPVVGIPKTANEDTTLTYQTIPDAEGNSRTESVFVPKGTDVLIDTPALHHNPMYWDNPKEFRPERFLEDYEKDAFIPFVPHLSPLTTNHSLHGTDPPSPCLTSGASGSVPALVRASADGSQRLRPLVRSRSLCRTLSSWPSHMLERRMSR